MQRLAFAVLLVVGCSSPAARPPDTVPAHDGDAPIDGDGASTEDASAERDGAMACPLPSEPNSSRLVQSAESQPAWVEIDVTIQFPDPPFDWAAFGTSSDAERDALVAQRKADLAPIQDDLEARLRKVGARNIERFWLTSSITAVVPAGAVPQIPCWPQVVELSGNALTSNGAPPPTECFGSSTCSGNCQRWTGDEIDLARSCARHHVPTVCERGAESASGDELTCYVELATGRVIALADQWIVDRGDPTVRKCTPAEGGAKAPSELPECP